MTIEELLDNKLNDCDESYNDEIEILESDESDTEPDTPIFNLDNIEDDEYRKERERNYASVNITPIDMKNYIDQLSGNDSLPKKKKNIKLEKNIFILTKK